MMSAELVVLSILITVLLIATLGSYISIIIHTYISHLTLLRDGQVTLSDKGCQCRCREYQRDAVRSGVFVLI